MIPLSTVLPGELRTRIHSTPDDVLVTAFNPPLTPPALQELVADLSSTVVAAHEVDVRVITHVPEISDSTALSLDALAPHTDGTFLEQPPPRFVLSCSDSDHGGAGASTLIDVDALVAAAPEWVVETLSTTHYRFLKTYDGDLTDSYITSVLTRRADGAWLIRWRADHLNRPAQPLSDSVERHPLADEAIAWVVDHLPTVEPVERTLVRGELMLIPNGRYLHGRTALSPSSRRRLLRAWVF